MRTIANIYRLGIKELWSLLRDPAMLILIAYVFTVAIHVAANSQPDSVHKATIAIVDEDYSSLSNRLGMAFFPPMFTPPFPIGLDELDPGMDKGRFTFSLNIPPNFQRDILALKRPALQLNVDATRMSQAFVGSGYIQDILMREINEFAARYHRVETPRADLTLRSRFNQNLDRRWFSSIVELINNITMLSIILTGAALIREREHGTIEHLLVMPVTPFEIMVSKIWSMALVVLVVSTLSLKLVVEGLLGVPIQGSVPLFLLGTALHLFATTSFGIFLATVARNMPQFGMLLILTLLPMQMLSGGTTPRESMPELVQHIMLLAPTTHFIEIGQSILYRGADLAMIYPSYLALAAIGGALFAFSLARFRKTLARMA